MLTRQTERQRNKHCHRTFSPLLTIREGLLDIRVLHVKSTLTFCASVNCQLPNTASYAVTTMTLYSEGRKQNKKTNNTQSCSIACDDGARGKTDFVQVFSQNPQYP